MPSPWYDVPNWRRNQVIDTALMRLTRKPTYETTLTYTARGNIVWAVTKVEAANVTEPDLRIILLVPVFRGEAWKYRFYDERDTLRWFTCPEGFLDQTAKSRKRNELWRSHVRDYHQKRRKRLRVGDRVKLMSDKIPEVEIIGLNPLVGVYGGTAYKIKRRHIQLEAQ